MQILQFHLNRFSKRLATTYLSLKNHNLNQLLLPFLSGKKGIKQFSLPSVFDKFEIEKWNDLDKLVAIHNKVYQKQCCSRFCMQNDGLFTES